MAHVPPAPDSETDPRSRGTARQAIILVLLTGLLLVVFAGDSVARAGQEHDEGLVRDVLITVGQPTGWVANHLPFAPVADQVAGWFSSDKNLGSPDGRFTTANATGGGGDARIPPAAFLHARTPLRNLLITGDSMSQPLDAVLARKTAGGQVRVRRDAKIGTGISKTDLVDWGKLPAEQLRERPADAVIVFLGANEGFPMPIAGRETDCCSPQWAAEYATRVRSIINQYRAGGAKRIYWLTVPAPREPARAQITGTVNAAIRVAAGGFGTQVQIVDASQLFTPGFRYRDALTFQGRERLVRDPDGVHLNERGAELLADKLLARLNQDFDL